MKGKFKTLMAVVAGLAATVLLAQQSLAVQINFGNTPGGQIQFLGANNFDFNPAGGATPGNNSFKITSGTANNDVGTMTSPLGGWTFNPVTGAVSGSGTLDIFDGVVSLTADLTWSLITVNGPGTGGQLNELLTANLTGILYTGGDPDLLALAAPGHATMTLSWTFPTGGHNLVDLGTTPQNTSFSGSLETTPQFPDGGVTVALLGFALLSVEGLRRKLVR